MAVSDEKFDQLFKMSNDVLSEVKKMTSVQEVRLTQHSKEIERLWDSVEKAAWSRKDIYSRIEDINNRCAANHGMTGMTGHNRRTSDQPGSMIEAWIGKKFYIAVSIVIGSMLGAAGINLLRALMSRGQ